MADEESWESMGADEAPPAQNGEAASRKPLTWKMDGQEAPANGAAPATAGDKKRIQGVPLPEGSEPPPGSVKFDHACCRAVRPNPEDPDSGVVETRKEPYLVHRTPLRPTALFGVWVMSSGLVGSLAFLFAVLEWDVLMLITVVLCMAVAAYLVISLVVANGGVKKLEVAATRHVIEPNLERGKIFHMTLDTNGTRIPAGFRAEITDLQSPGLRPVEKPTVDGNGVIHYKVRPQGRGLLTFKGLEVNLESRNGLWTQRQEWRLRTTVEVTPSLVAASLRAQLTGYVPFGLSAPKSLVKLYRDVEHEETKLYGAGDRIKEIDWKRMAINNKMIVRKRWSDVEGTIIVFIDMGQTMLQDQAGFRNVDLAVEYAHELSAAALYRNHEVGMVAFNEERIIDHVRPTRKKTQMKRLIEHFTHIADHHLPEPGEKPIEIKITGDPENLRLGMQQVIKQRQTAQATLMLISDLQSTPEEIVQTLAKAAGSGLPTLVWLLPEPRLKPLLFDAKGRPLKTPESEEELRGSQHTNRMREILLGRQVDFIEVHPMPEEFQVDVPLPPELQHDDDGMPPPPAPPAPAAR